MNEIENKILRNAFTSIIESMEYTIPSNIEVVLHDLKQVDNTIIKILNGHVSGRTGDSKILEAPEQDIGFLLLQKGEENKGMCANINGYETTTKEGKKLKSASTIYFDSEGKPSIAICINVDLTIFEKLKQDLSLLEIKKRSLDKNNIHNNSLNQKSKILEVIDSILKKYDGQGKVCKKPIRVEIVKELNELGVLKIRGSVNIVSKKLNVSRYTIYNDILDLK